ncbi:MAG: L,D-transpeptidase family protein [Planctomycetaceae bacterium]
MGEAKQGGAGWWWIALTLGASACLIAGGVRWWQSFDARWDGRDPSAANSSQAGLQVDPVLPEEIAQAQFEPEVADSEEPAAELPADDASDDEILRAQFTEQPRSERTAARSARDAASGGVTAGTSPGDVPEPVAEADPSGAGKLRDLEQIAALEQVGDFVAAQEELSRWYWKRPELRERLLPRLNKLARAIYFAPQPHYYEPYVVQPGDQLRVIAQRYRLSWEYLARLNKVDAKKIRMGQKLKVISGPLGAIISLGRYELVVHQNGSFVKSYRVGIGKDDSTPLGTFTVRNKMVDPTYYGPDGVIAHDDPQNPLGERWIDIGDGYGIHGTIEPDSIGRSESRGCIRLLNEDADEVYDLLIVGSEVKILR